MQSQIDHEDSRNLFRHQRRPQWGPGLLVGEEDTRRILQFQDGQLRKLKKGYYHLLKPCDFNETRAAVVVEELEELHQQVRADQSAQARALDRPPVMTFSEQIRVFTALYPEGFADPDYRDAWRSVKEGRSSKRHTDRAIEAAKLRLGRERLHRLLEAGEHEEVLESLLTVLRRTSLASPSKLIRPLAEVEPPHREPLAAALVDLLYGEAQFRKRLRRWLLALGEVPSLRVTWPMVTLPASLRFPRRHVAVRRRIFQLQARILLPDSIVRRRPTPRSYRAVKRVAGAVRDALLAEGLQPADMVDVHAFAWETLRPKGIRLHEQLTTRSAA